MPLLPPEHYRLLRAWVEHIVCAYWTHGGYLNWDTGYGFKRWHAGRTWALAQQGLLAIAVVAALPHPARDRVLGEVHVRSGPRPVRAAVARSDRRARASRPSNLYDVNVSPLGPSIREMFAARMQANAARAVALGLGCDGRRRAAARCIRSTRTSAGSRSRRRATPPRCCRSTSTHFLTVAWSSAACTTATSAWSSNVGGRPWASFGVLVRDRFAPGGRHVAAPAVVRIADSADHAAVLPARPGGRGAAVSVASLRGPVREPDRARAHARRSEVVIGTTHKFTRAMSRRGGTSSAKLRERYTVDVLFPSWGKTARVEAVMRGGGRMILAQAGAKRRRSRCATSSTSTLRARRRDTSWCRRASARVRRRTS